MSARDPCRGTAVALTGPPFERGRQQAASFPELVASVRNAVALRMDETAEALAAPATRAYVDALRQFHQRNDPDIMAEIAGIGEGFGIDKDRLFDYLNLSLVADLDPPAGTVEECTAFAVSDPGRGALVAKNRDYRAEHFALQKVFHHRDPAWGGRQVLCLGSLGSPGNFSSGMNSDGLAVADTASRTTRHGVGRHRYFLLTRLLTHCATVAEALADITSVPHAGGGLLVMGDATGTVATVELGHNAVAFEVRTDGWVARSNHFAAELTAPLNRVDGGQAAGHRNSLERLPEVRGLLERAEGPMGVAAAADILSHHGGEDGPSLCRHGDGDLSQTISGSIYVAGEGRMLFAEGNPCRASWASFALDGAQAP